MREAVRTKLVRTEVRTSNADARDIVEAAAERGVAIVTSHRRDVIQLRALAKILAERLSQHLDGVEVTGIGERESASDVLAKLTQVTARLIPLERQANGLDAPGTPERDGVADEAGGAIERLIARVDRERASRVVPEPVAD